MKRRLIIEGERVQDTGYRMFLLNLASEHDLTGFQARNVGKKMVEALYEGDDEAVRAFESDVRVMIPEGARVDWIHFEDYDGPVKDIERFRSHFMTLQLGKKIEVGLTMVQKQDETLEELKGVRKDLKSMLDERLTALERDVALIKERLGIK